MTQTMSVLVVEETDAGENDKYQNQVCSNVLPKMLNKPESDFVSMMI